MCARPLSCPAQDRKPRWRGVLRRRCRRKRVRRAARLCSGTQRCRQLLRSAQYLGIGLATRPSASVVAPGLAAAASRNAARGVRDSRSAVSLMVRAALRYASGSTGRPMPWRTSSSTAAESTSSPMSAHVGHHHVDALADVAGNEFGHRSGDGVGAVVSGCRTPCRGRGGWGKRNRGSQERFSRHFETVQKSE